MITSASNERIKQVRSLLSLRKNRHKLGLYVAEGPHLLQEAIRTQAEVTEVFYTTEFAATMEGKALLASTSGLSPQFVEVDNVVMMSISNTKTPQGVVSVVPIQDLKVTEQLDFVLVLDNIRDPGNVGTIMRVAASAGVQLMIVPSGTADLYNPKVVRSAMGAHFSLPVRHMSWEAVATYLNEMVIFLADSRGGTEYYRMDWTQPCALIVSDEAHGPSHEAQRTAHARVMIPMPGGADSLNVGVATGVLIYEGVRQRRLAKEG
jgi:TrmH family RNA methyltransferase